MKTRTITSILAALCAAVPLARADERKGSASSSVTSNGDGTATVTIEVNGKKETKTIKLGDAKPFTFKMQDGSSIAVGGGSAGKVEDNKPARMEKETWLGIAIEPVGDDVRAQLPLKEGEGLTVSHVMPESPAAKAGIEKLDIVTRLDDQILVSGEQLRALVKMRKPGDKVKISYLRKAGQHDVEVMLEEHEVPAEEGRVFGMHVGPDGAIQFNGKNWDAKQGELRKRLNEMKQDHPGVIVDKQAWLIGPDGEKRKFDMDGKLDDLLSMTRKHLNEANLPDDIRKRVSKAVEEAMKSQLEASESAKPKKNSDGDHGEAPVKPDAGPAEPDKVHE